MKVTDEMVFKARSAHQDDEGIVYSTQRAMRRALEAALSEDEEIPVSDGAAMHGVAALNSLLCCFELKHKQTQADVVREIYRAIERQRIREASPGVGRANVHYRRHELTRVAHRRKDDP